MINKVLLMKFFKDDDIKVVDKDFYIKSQMKNDVIKYITILEEENERLKRLAEKDYTESNIAEMNATIYKSRCEKVKEYIMSNLITEWDIENDGYVSGSDLPAYAIIPILDIVNGVDDE